MCRYRRGLAKTGRSSKHRFQLWIQPAKTDIPLQPLLGSSCLCMGIEAAIHTYDLSLEQVVDLDVRIDVSLVVHPFDPETEETQELRLVTDKISKFIKVVIADLIP